MRLQSLEAVVLAGLLAFAVACTQAETTQPVTDGLSLHSHDGGSGDHDGDTGDHDGDSGSQDDDPGSHDDDPGGHDDDPGDHDGGTQGCTPGYWKNHLSAWPAPYAPGDDFDAVFGVNAFDPDITLEAALNLGGGKLSKLGRHAVAALLSAASADYPQSPAEVIAAVAAAINAGTYEPLATQLDTWNNLGCPN